MVMSKINKVALYFKSLGVWIRAFWSVVLVVVAGRLFFFEEIVHSIESTPHPSLVYTIFGTAALAVLIFGYSLSRYVAEAHLLARMYDSLPQERTQTLDELRWTPDLLPVYRLLINLKDGSTRIRADAFENELIACEGKVLSRLTAADYLGGALVGLGLVGTFVGLLGTLNDLGKIFESLVNVGAKDVDPVAMFGGMIAKLQDPMRGMSTAFVASLYGLMGSLVIGLVALSVRHTGVSLCKNARELLKADLYGDGIPDDVVPTGDPAVSPAIANALKAIPAGIEAVLHVQNNLLTQSKQLLDEHRAWFDRHRAFDVRMAEILRSVTTQSELHTKQIEAYQKSHATKPWMLLAVISIIAAVVSAIMMMLIYARLGEARHQVVTVPPVPSVMQPVPVVPSVPSVLSVPEAPLTPSALPKHETKPVIEAATAVAEAASTVSSDALDIKPADQVVPAATAAVPKKSKSKSEMANANKRSKAKAQAKAKAEVLKSEDEQTKKCELDPAQCTNSDAAQTPAVENTQPAASSEEAK
jgi:hypothetical protein